MQNKGFYKIQDFRYLQVCYFGSCRVDGLRGMFSFEACAGKLCFCRNSGHYAKLEFRCLCFDLWFARGLALKGLLGFRVCVDCWRFEVCWKVLVCRFFLGGVLRVLIAGFIVSRTYQGVGV